MIKTSHAANRTAPRPPLRLGFVPLTDCAPVIMAAELGLFQKYGLRVSLSRELGWATIRDKIVHGNLEAAHALASMPVAATLGLGSIQCDCLTALVLSLHGNAITLSEELWRNDVRDGASLRRAIQRPRGQKTFTFGVVHRFSSHHYLLRHWLARSRINPDRDVRITVVPPPQMAANLRAGHLDGYCAGEPWNSVAVQTGAGWCVAASAELAPGHPEKVLMVRREFAERHADEHLALVTASLEACEFCDAPGNREQLIATLARPEYVGTSEAALRRSLLGKFDFGHGTLRHVPDFHLFHSRNANEPSGEKAAWVFQHLRDLGIGREPAALDVALSRRVFRPEIFDQAQRLRASGRVPAGNDTRTPQLESV